MADPQFVIYQNDTGTSLQNASNPVSNRTGAFGVTPGSFPPPDDPFPFHQLLWRLGIIFAVAGILIFCTVAFLYILRYTKKSFLFGVRRRRAAQAFGYQNQVNTLEGENGSNRAGACTGKRRSRDASPSSRDGAIGDSQSCSRTAPEVHTSCGHVRRRSRDDGTMEDDPFDAIPSALDSGRLAFKEDFNSVEFNSSKQKVTMEI